MTQLLTAPSTGAGGGIDEDDPRLDNARTPTAHAATHADGGTDEVTLTAAQISDLATAIASGIASWVSTTPVGLDTLVEIANQFSTDESAVGALTTVVSSKAPALTTTAEKTANYNVGANELVPFNTTSGSLVATLPNAPADGTRVCIKHVVQGSSNIVTINCAGSDVFNKTGGATAATLPMAAQAMQFQYKASSHIWYIVADDQPLSQLDLRFLKRTEPALGQPDTNMTHLTTTKILGILNHAGPPVAGDLTSGTFPAGGQVYDNTGQEYICLVAGSPGTWVAIGSGKVIGGPIIMTSSFTMTTAATAEDIPGMSVSAVYDGRPINFVATPANTRSDTASKIITLSLRRSSDSVPQATVYKYVTPVNTADTAAPIMTGPISAWPSDGVPFSIGATITMKLNITAGTLAKGTYAGASASPIALYAITQ